MSAIDQQFAKLKAAGKKAFVPFITAGDPSLELTAKAIKQLASSGAALIEVGIPYSDPIADGPVIQESYFRALSRGVTTDQIFEMVGRVTRDVAMPLVGMVSYSIIFRTGVSAFMDRMAAAGFRGLIVPDLPLDEAAAVRASCLEHDLDWIPLVTPTTPAERAGEIARSATGFIYYVSVAGTTGERSQIAEDLPSRIERLRDASDAPIAVGFGISSPDQAAELRGAADGVIVGSALVRKISAADGPDAAREEIVEFCEQAVAALRP